MTETTPTTEATINLEEVLKWLLNYRTGMASENIAAHLTGARALAESGPVWSDHRRTPDDTGSFQRCLELLSVAPSLRPHLDRMRSLSPAWNDLMDQWPHLEELFMAWWTAKDEEARQAALAGYNEVGRILSQIHNDCYIHNGERGKYISDEVWEEYQAREEQWRVEREEQNARWKAQQEREEREYQQAQQQTFNVGDIIRYRLPRSQKEHRARFVVQGMESKPEWREAIVRVSRIHGQGYTAYQAALQATSYSGLMVSGMTLDTPAAEVQPPKRSGKKADARVTILEDAK